MNITVVGNYNSNNAGDDFYLHLLREKYPQHNISPYKKGDTPEFIIFGGGGLLNPDSNKRIEWIRSKGIPFCALSIGSVGAVRKTNFTGIYSYLSNAEFVTCRDNYAFEHLSKINKATELLPDLVWNYQPRVKKVKEEKLTIGIMLRHSTKFNDSDLVYNFHNVINEALRDTDYKLLFFNTYGEKLKDRTLHNQLSRGHNAEMIPHHKTKDMISHLSNFNRCDKAIVMPYHGFVFSEIYGVPSIGWAYETKVQELCERELIQEYAYDFEDNYKIVDFLKSETPKESKATQLREKAKGHFEKLDKYLL